MEKDPLSSDFLGSTKAIKLETLTEYEGLCKHDEVICDKNNNKAGNIQFNT